MIKPSLFRPHSSVRRLGVPLLVTALFALPGLAQADPVSAAIATALTSYVGATAAAAIGTFIVNTAIYTSISATRERMFGRKP